MKYTLRTLLLAAAISIPAAAAVAENTASGRVMTNSRAAAATTLSDSVSVHNLSGTQIRQLQQSLHAQGLYNGRVDGVWGPNTARALTRFEQQNNLRSSVVGTATGSSLNSETLGHLGLLSRNNAGADASGGVRADSRTNARGGAGFLSGADIGTGSSANFDGDARTSGTTGTRANSSAGVGVGVDSRGNTTMDRNSGRGILGTNLGLGADVDADVDADSGVRTGTASNTSRTGGSLGVSGRLNSGASAGAGNP